MGVLRRWLVVLALGFPLGGIGAVAFAASYEGRGDLLIDDIVGADPWGRQMVPGAREATGEFCDEELPCVEALTSETLTMYRFPDSEQAAAAADSFGEHGYLSGWVAVRYEPDALTPRQRAEFERGIGCVGSSAGEDC